jgi:hypothetical protein
MPIENSSLTRTVDGTTTMKPTISADPPGAFFGGTSETPAIFGPSKSQALVTRD